ncbi:MAG TPA: ATP-binding protein [Acidimicrobiia bacterium]|nr:ATP-binding protein [Acidimicrobiia bacterium]
MNRRSRALPATRASPAAARQLVRAAIADAGIAVDPDAAALATSEIVANVVQHAHTAMRLEVAVGDTVRVTVTDTRPDLPVPTSLDPDAALATRGRGLQLVDRLSSRWGLFGDRDSKTVWFEIEPAAAGPRGAPAHAGGDAASSVR